MQRLSGLGKNDLLRMLPRKLKVCNVAQLFIIYYHNTLIDLYLAEPILIAKSIIILDVKPWDDETNMREMEKEVRKIETDGLLWGACKFP